MLTGQIRNQIDQIWNDFWSGGVSNPLSVIEQITYLLFIKRLDELHTLEENKAQALGRPMERRIFPEGTDPKGRPYQDLRWSRFRNFEAREMMEVVDEHVFPFLRTLGEEGSSYGRHMKDARLGFSNPNLLAKVVAKRWQTATPRATSTNTCSARSRPPGRTASSARPGTSSS
jgi:type I restriction enzyme M protein